MAGDIQRGLLVSLSTGPSYMVYQLDGQLSGLSKDQVMKINNEKHTPFDSIGNEKMQYPYNNTVFNFFTGLAVGYQWTSGIALYGKVRMNWLIDRFLENPEGVVFQQGSVLTLSSYMAVNVHYCFKELKIQPGVYAGVGYSTWSQLFYNLHIPKSGICFNTGCDIQLADQLKWLLDVCVSRLLIPEKVSKQIEKETIKLNGNVQFTGINTGIRYFF
jgi:hypothetical protein